MRGHKNQGGFALLVALSLMAFVMLLLLSFVAITRVETQMATRNQQVGQARQNALLAVQLALGELQKYSGPDQRVTSTADLISNEDRAGTASPASETISVKDGARFWTGVWGNGQGLPSQYVDRYELKPDEINGRGTSPVLLNWLVSGNELTTYEFQEADGSVTAGSAPEFSPDGLITWPSDVSATSTEITLQRSDGSLQAAALLVGPNSVGNGSVEDYVVAPMVEVESVSGTSTGRYAWWVGDAGVKARLNLQNGYAETGQPMDRINSFITSQRSSVPSMDRNRTGDLIGVDFDADKSEVTQLLSLEQLPLAGDIAGAESRLGLAGQARFHDLTTYSKGVLADSYNGGLKKDLTADIADTSSDSSYRPADNDPIFTPLDTGEAHLPTWGHLRSWARLQPSGGTLSPVVPSDTQAGFYPIVAYASLGLSTYVDTDDSNTIHVSMYPVIVLSNPYSVGIAAAEYEIGFQLNAGACLYYRTAPASTAINASPSDNSVFTTEATLDLGTMTLHQGEKTPEELEAQNPNRVPVRFNVSGSIIPPGETHVYVLDPSDDGQSYQPGRLMTRAPNSSFIGLINRVELAPTLPVSISPTVAPDQRKLVVWSKNVSLGASSVWTADALRVEFSQLNGFGNPAMTYQTFEMKMSGHQIAPNGFRIFQDSGVNLPISNNWDSDPGQATAAIRIGCALDARYTFSDPGGTVGMTPFLFKPWLRLGNLRAPFSLPTYAEAATTSEGGPIALEGRSSNLQRVGSMVMGALLANPIASMNTALITGHTSYTVNLAGWPQSSQPPYYATYFDILESPDRLLSMGQLQHVPFSRYSFYGAYPFGNSVADVHIDRTTTYRLGLSSGLGPASGPGIIMRPEDTALFDPAYDVSWHLNRALWDQYFVSSVPSNWTQARIDAGEPLPNARMEFSYIDGAPPELESIQGSSGNGDAYVESAANLMVAGAFNINSTSEQAWRAVLAGTLGLPNDDSYSEASDAVDQIIPFPRFSRHLGRSANDPYVGATTTMATDLTSEKNFLDTYYHGNRGLFLNDPAAGSKNASAQAVVNELARTLVQEIRRRGPFLSLADFINRPIYNTREDAGIKGAIQAAIDRSEAPGQVNPMEVLTAYARRTTNEGIYRNPYPSWDDEHYMGGPDSELDSGRDAFRLLSAFAPKYLTQADILSTLGPMLSARSDTFTIRTYGESRNSVTDEIEGRAWCEAVVQRMPEYVDSNTVLNAWDPPAGASKNFGRQYRIVSLRWLNPSNI